MAESAAAVGSRKRVPKYDIARVAAIAFVVLIHVLAPLVGPEQAVLGDSPGPILIASRSLRFAVPLFVVLTGALLWTRPFGGARSWGAFFRRRFAAVALPYLAWSAVYVGVGMWTEIRPWDGVRPLVDDLLLGTTWYHLYFVPIIVGVYLLTPAAVALVARAPLWCVAASLALALVVPWALDHVALRPALSETLLLRIVHYAPYAALGAWYAARGKLADHALRWGWPALLAVGLGLRAAQTYELLPTGGEGSVLLLDIVVNALPSLAIIAAGAAIVRGRKAPADRSATWSQAAYGVYLIHPLALLGLERALAVLGWAWPLPAAVSVGIVWPVVSVAVFALVVTASRARWLWWLHGVRARRAPAR